MRPEDCRPEYAYGEDLGKLFFVYTVHDGQVQSWWNVTTEDAKTAAEIWCENWLHSGDRATLLVLDPRCPTKLPVLFTVERPPTCYTVKPGAVTL